MIRAEKAADMPAIFQINEQAASKDEALLIDRLRAAGKLLLSLVAEIEGQLVGHIAFSLVQIKGENEDWSAVGLGPVAVMPAFQNQGIGIQLINHGLTELRQQGHSAVVLIGHPTYYPRFGFMPASRFGLSSTYDVPDDVFMALELQTEALAEVSGVVHYQPEFEGV